MQTALPALGKRRESIAVPKPGELACYQIGELRVAAGWTGMGRLATERFLSALPAPPRAILHLGVAGGLRDDLVAGDAVLCTRAYAADEVVECEAHKPLADLLACSRSGACTTVGAVAGTPSAKRALAQRHPDALVVEMETFWAARKAAELGHPIACVRVVCDALGDTLPDLSPALDPVGRPRPLAMLKHLATRPGAIGKLPQLASAFAQAQRTLTELIIRVATHLDPDQL